MPLLHHRLILLRRRAPLLPRSPVSPVLPLTPNRRHSFRILPWRSTACSPIWPLLLTLPFCHPPSSRPRATMATATALDPSSPLSLSPPRFFSSLCVCVCVISYQGALSFLNIELNVCFCFTMQAPGSTLSSSAVSTSNVVSLCICVCESSCLSSELSACDL